ncbi:MAG: guanylate kinase [Chloroflexi bacterium RBG_16_56_11]|nr:MAG: guanylate kinase [Chloroflexi bacterium RBG_16_56_11]
MAPKNPEKFPDLRPARQPLLIVLSGLSGSGKDVVLERLRQSGYPIEFIVTLTTRARRSNEKDGVHYRFVTPARFQELIERKELLEWANVYENWYGVPNEPVREALAAGKDVIVKIDVQGAATVKRILPGAVLIFLATPSMEELEQRLRQRRTESASDVEVRLKTARKELQQLRIFDYIVINREGEVDRAVEEIRAIITAEKCRVKPREIKL